MKKTTRRGLLACLALLATPMAAHEIEPPRPPQAGAVELTDFKGPYLGQPKPGRRAVPFAPGFFRSDIYSAVSFSRDGTEAYWSSQGHIYWSKQVNGTWTKPAEIVFNSTPGVCPMLSPDGTRLYFNTWEKGSRIVYVERTASGWSENRVLPDVVNSTPNKHWNVSVDLQGNLYFGIGRTNRDVQIVYSPRVGASYAPPAPIKALEQRPTVCPFVAPDGSYLLFVGTEPEKGDKALFIAFKKRDGGWTSPKNVTDIIGERGFSPTVSPDGKYLFFWDRGTMYWADASFIEELRTQEVRTAPLVR